MITGVIELSDFFLNVVAVIFDNFLSKLSAVFWYIRSDDEMVLVNLGCFEVHSEMVGL